MQKLRLLCQSLTRTDAKIATRHCSTRDLAAGSASAATSRATSTAPLRGRRRVAAPVSTKRTLEDEHQAADSSPPLPAQGLLASYMNREAILLALLVFLGSALLDLIVNQRSSFLQKLKDRCMLTLQVRSSQREYAMIMDWMARQPQGRRAHNLSIRPVTVLDEQQLDGRSAAADGQDAASALVPGYGSHLFQFGSTYLWIAREEDVSKQRAGGRFNAVDREHEVLTLTFLTRRRAVVEDFLAAVRESWRTHVKNKVSVYIGCQYSSDGWQLLTERDRRPLNTLFLPPHITCVVDEVRAFLGMREVYARLGVPWRRGYLLEGPPGTGKTSFVLALASELNLPVHVLSLQTNKLDDEGLLTMVSGLPRRAVLLIEDVENAIIQPGAGDSSNGGGSDDAENGGGAIGGGGGSRVSMSALLNALDGVTSSDGRVLIMTSNDVSKIPSSAALLRPGRVDRQIHFSPLESQDQAAMRASFAAAVEDLLPASHSGVSVANTVAATEAEARSGTTPAEFQQQLLASLFERSVPGSSVKEEAI